MKLQFAQNILNEHEQPDLPAPPKCGTQLATCQEVYGHCSDKLSENFQYDVSKARRRASVFSKHIRNLAIESKFTVADTAFSTERCLGLAFARAANHCINTGVSMPMDASDFSNLLNACCQAPVLDLKQTSHKKLKRYLQHLSSRGYIDISIDSSKVCITRFHRNMLPIASEARHHP